MSRCHPLILDEARELFANRRAGPATFDEMCRWMEGRYARAGHAARVAWNRLPDGGVNFTTTFAEPIHQVTLRATVKDG